MDSKQDKKQTATREFTAEIDAHGRLISMDANGLALMGYSSADLSGGLNSLDLIVESDRRRARENIQRILRGERIGLSSYTLTDRSGAMFPVLINSRRKEDKSGMVCTIFLPTQASHFADLMWEHQQMFQTVIEAIPSGLCMVNDKGCITHWNPAAEKLSGLNAEQVIGRTCKEIFNCPNHSVSCLLSLMRPGPAEPLCTDVVLNVMGRAIHLQKTSNYIHAPDGRIIGSIESFVDLTQQREAEAALQEARELVLSARQAKRHFMANMNHEIRTPINGILGLLNLMLSEKTTPLQQEYITTAKRTAHHLVELINDILDFTIIDKDKLRIEATGFSLSSIVSSVVSRQYDQCRNKEVYIHSRIDPDVPDSILGDSGRLYQILKHLVGNSIKFTPTGEVSIQVARVPAAKRPENDDPRRVVLHFAIHDTGVGIPGDKLDLIFESLSQVDESSTRLFGGLGIGLNIVKGLVKLLDGRIWLESNSGKGTVAHLILPFKCASVGDTVSMNHTEYDSFAPGGQGVKVGQISSSPGSRHPVDPSNSDHYHSTLAPLPLSRKWHTKFQTLQAAIDTDLKTAETLLIELKNEAKTANQNALETLILRLLLAVRREDKGIMEHYFSILKEKITTDKQLCSNSISKGEHHENIDRRR